MKKQLLRKQGRRSALALFGLILLLGVLPLGSRAQVARYAFSQSSQPYVPLTGGTVLATALAQAPPGPPGLSGTVHPLLGVIPFPFVFNGTAYTSGAVASGGYLTLGGVLPFERFTPIPGTGIYYDIDRPLSATVGTDYDAAIAVMAGDIWGNTSPAVAPLGELRYQTLGTAPNRVFVVQWANMRVYASATGLLNYQVRLYETTNVVELAYGACQSSLALSTQVGLRGFTPNDFNNRTGTWAASTPGAANTDALVIGPASAPASGLVYTFTPPAPLPCSQPFSLSAVPAGTQARLSWRALAPNPGPYTVVWGPAGFNPAQGGLGTQSVAGTSCTVTGLVPTTNYEFYVTQACGGTAGTSPPSSPPGRFRTTILNDEAVDAIALPTTATCQPLTFSNVGATTSPSNGYDPLRSCGSGQLPLDVWFTVTTAAAGPASRAIHINLNSPSINGRPSPVFSVRVLSSANGAAGPFTQLYCNSYNIAVGVSIPPFIVDQLLPSTTYYILAANDSYLGASDLGNFTICSTVPPACGNPTNVNAFFVNTGSTSVVADFQPGGGATGYIATFTPVVPPGGAPITRTLPATRPPLIIGGLQPATTYSATLQATCAGGSVSAAQPFTAYTRPVNDSVANAIALPLTATCQPVAGSTQNASGTDAFTVTGCGTRSADVWYTFTTPATGPASTAVRIVATGAPAEVVRVLTRAGAGGPLTQVFCGTASGSTGVVLDVSPLTASTQYYLVVGNISTSSVQGPFTICVTSPTTCGTPVAVGISSITNTSANLTFITGRPAPAGTSYTVTLVALGGATATLPNVGSSGAVALTGLAPGTFYTATLVANCGAGAGDSQPVTVTFLTTGPPANDLCANAQLLRCGDGPLPGSVLDATTTGDPVALCAGTAPRGPGVWYRLPGTGQDATITTCYRGTNSVNPDMQIFAYSGNCGTLACLGNNDDAPGCTLRGNTPALTFATTAGVDYYLLLADTGYIPAADHDGRFEITATCAAPAACPAPTGVTVVPAGPTAATVRWTAVPGATRYQVVWQVVGAGGDATADAAPLAPTTLTNTQLLPNTAYLVTVSAVCAGNTQRSVGTTVAFTTVLSVRNPALAAQVALYPNPARGTATLEVPAALRGAGGATATLYNALGQAVRRLPVPPGAAPVRLDVAGLPTGRYLLRLDTPFGALGKALEVE